jgi:hypothetical protein
VEGSIRFTITFDDMLAAQRLLSRKLALGVGTVLILVGVGVVALGYFAGLAVSILGLVILVEWRFPMIDRWILRRRAGVRVGSECELWTDQTGVAFRQTGLNGHFDWPTITAIREDDRSLILMQGASPLMGIPKRAFASSADAAAFIAEVRRAADIDTD